MYVIGQSGKITFTDKLLSRNVTFEVIFLSAENINFSDKEIDLESAFGNRFSQFGYMVLASDKKSEMDVFINYDDFSAGKNAKIAYQISKHEIEFVAQNIYDTYLSLVDQDIFTQVDKLRMDDLFANDELDFLP